MRINGHNGCTNTAPAHKCEHALTLKRATPALSQRGSWRGQGVLAGEWGALKQRLFTYSVLVSNPPMREKASSQHRSSRQEKNAMELQPKPAGPPGTKPPGHLLSANKAPSEGTARDSQPSQGPWQRLPALPTAGNS